MLKIQQRNLSTFQCVSKGTSQEVIELNKITYAPHHIHSSRNSEVSTHAHVSNGPAGPVTKLSHCISLRKGLQMLCNSSSNLWWCLHKVGWEPAVPREENSASLSRAPVEVPQVQLQHLWSCLTKLLWCSYSKVCPAASTYKEETLVWTQKWKPEITQFQCWPSL